MKIKDLRLLNQTIIFLYGLLVTCIFISKWDVKISSLRVNIGRASLRLYIYTNTTRLSTVRPIITPIDFRIVPPLRNVCEGVQPYMIILVPGTPAEFEIRKTIRQTYGSLSKDMVNKIGKWTLKHIVRLVFLLGRSSDSFINQKIIEEQETYGDVIQFDFEDSYFNLTLKVLQGFKWVKESCNQSTFVLKADTDSFVNIAALLDELDKIPVPPEGAVYGHKYGGPCVIRGGKWEVRREVYDNDTYPEYVAGAAYVVTVNLLPSILETAQHLVYMPAIEDAFITGIIRTKLGGRIFHFKGMSSPEEKKISDCEFVNKTFLAKTNLEVMHFNAIWDAMRDFDGNCLQKNSKNGTA